MGGERERDFFCSPTIVSWVQIYGAGRKTPRYGLVSACNWCVRYLQIYLPNARAPKREYIFPQSSLTELPLSV